MSRSTLALVRCAVAAGVAVAGKASERSVFHSIVGRRVPVAVRRDPFTDDASTRDSAWRVHYYVWSSADMELWVFSRARFAGVARVRRGQWSRIFRAYSGSGKALFSSENLWEMDTVAFSFVFDKYCPIMD
jgi:hypothetical protein